MNTSAAGQTRALGGAIGRIVEELARTVIPVTPRLGLRAEPIVVPEFASFLAAVPALVRLFYVTLLWAFELSALFRYGRRFTRLDTTRKAAWLAAWHHSRVSYLRIALRALITPLKLAYFADAEVSRRIGWLPPTHAPALPALERLPGLVVSGEEAGADLEMRAEVVVIGTGAGGAVVAKELAELGRDVVLLEEGAFHATPSFTRRALEMSNRMYRDVGVTVALGRPGIPIPVGRTVGGTTTINSGTCFRVPDKTVDKWRSAFGLPVTVEELAPYYERVEKIIEVQPVAEAVLGRSSELVRLGATRLGLHPKPLARNAAGCRGSGLCCFGCPTDAKRSTNVTYVPMALRAGARLVTGARAQRVVTERGRAVGVVASLAGGHSLRVRTEAVVVACGTLHTPLLLKKSRLAGKSGQLGRNMSIHPAAKVNALFEEDVNGWAGVPQGLWIDDLSDEGITFEGAFTPPEYGAIGFPFVGRHFVEVMEKYAKVATFGLMVEDQSQGRVFVGPDDRPVPFYNISAHELGKLRKGIDVLCRIFLAAGAKVVYPPLASVEEIRSEAELSKLPKSIDPGEVELSAFHPLGTCRMGVEPRSSVIDPWLEHHQVDGLFVVDGSVFPSSLGRNPQLTIMAFATREAEHIRRRIGGAARWARGS